MNENSEILKFDYHIHSLYSDGDNELIEMVNANIEEGIKEIAFTDHLDHFGYFLHTWHNKYPSNSLESYIHRIKHIRERKKDKIKIIIGAEISTDIFFHSNPNNRTSDLLEPLIGEFSLFLIEGWYISQPIASSFNLKNHLNNLGFEDIPVIIAHPYFGSINKSILVKLIEQGIGVELNNPKFSKIEQENFLNLLHSLESEDRKNLIISFGSDSHSISEVGNIEKVRKFIFQHDLVENVVKLK